MLGKMVEWVEHCVEGSVMMGVKVRHLSKQTLVKTFGTGVTEYPNSMLGRLKLEEKIDLETKYQLLQDCSWFDREHPITGQLVELLELVGLDFQDITQPEELIQPFIQEVQSQIDGVELTTNLYEWIEQGVHLMHWFF